MIIIMTLKVPAYNKMLHIKYNPTTNHHHNRKQIVYLVNTTPNFHFCQSIFKGGVIHVGINKGIRNPGLSSYQKSNYDNQTEHRIPKRLLGY